MADCLAMGGGGAVWCPRLACALACAPRRFAARPLAHAPLAIGTPLPLPRPNADAAERRHSVAGDVRLLHIQGTARAVRVRARCVRKCADCGCAPFACTALAMGMAMGCALAALI